MHTMGNRMRNRKCKLAFIVVTALLSGCGGFSGPSTSTTSGTKPVTKLANFTANITDQAVFSIAVDSANPASTTGEIVDIPGEKIAITASSGNPTALKLCCGGIAEDVTTVTFNKDSFGGKTNNAKQQQVTVLPKGQNVLPTLSSAPNGLQYSNFGFWVMDPPKETPFVVTVGVFGSGGAAPTTTMPASGTATYTGLVTGISHNSSDHVPYILSGNLSMTANFAPTNTITGSMTGMTSTNAFIDAAAGSFNDVALSGGVITGNGFSGTATAGAAGTSPASITAGTVGRFIGHFYGPSANEVTGLWGMGNGSVQVRGAFGAKQ